MSRDEADPDRRCRQCGATSGLVMLPYGPLDPPMWECVDGCKTAAPNGGEPR